jgi:hypothetical protein
MRNRLATYEDILVTFAYATAKKSRGLIKIAAIREAVRRVGATSRDRLGWVLKFASEDLSDPSPGKALDVRLELGAFLAIPGWMGELPDAIKLPDIDNLFPSLKEAWKLHELLNTWLQSYVEQGEILIVSPGKTTYHLTRDGFDFGALDRTTRCAVNLMRLIREFPEHVRCCPKEQHGCGKWFLAERTDAVYCSKTCAGRKRIAEFRARERKGVRKHAKK